jgi:hypothetical protein
MVCGQLKGVARTYVDLFIYNEDEGSSQDGQSPEVIMQCVAELAAGKWISGEQDKDV